MAEPRQRPSTASSVLRRAVELAAELGPPEPAEPPLPRTRPTSAQVAWAPAVYPDAPVTGTLAAVPAAAPDAVPDAPLKIGSAAQGERLRVERRALVRTWTRDDVRVALTHDGSLREFSVFVPISLINDERALSRREEAASAAPSFGVVGERRRVPLIDALYMHRVDGSALVDTTQADLMRGLGVAQVGVAKAVLRCFSSLLDPQRPLPVECGGSALPTAVLGRGAPAADDGIVSDNDGGEIDAAAAAASSMTGSRRPQSAPLGRGVAVRYAALNPFEGWEMQLGLRSSVKSHLLATRQGPLGQAARPAASASRQRAADAEEAATQRALDAARAALDATIERERQEAMAAAVAQIEEDRRNERPSASAQTVLRAAVPTDHGAPAEAADALPTSLVVGGAFDFPLERVIAGPSSSSDAASGYRLGPLERERRLAEIRAAHKSLHDVLGDDGMTLGWFVTAAGEFFGWGGADAAPGMARALLITIRAARGAKERTVAMRRPASPSPTRRRPASAQPLRSKPAVAGLNDTSLTHGGDDTVGALPDHGDSDATIFGLRLQRFDFKTIVMHLCLDKPPHVFDGLLRHFSNEFGAERVEAARRVRAAAALFRRCDAERRACVSREFFGKLLAEYNAWDLRRQQQHSAGGSTRASSPGLQSPSNASAVTLAPGMWRLGRGSAASRRRNRPQSAPSASLTSAIGGAGNASVASHATATTATGALFSARGGSGISAAVEVDEPFFIAFVTEQLSDEKPADFDAALLQLRVITEQLLLRAEEIAAIAAEEAAAAAAEEHEQLPSVDVVPAPPAAAPVADDGDDPLSAGPAAASLPPPAAQPAARRRKKIITATHLTRTVAAGTSTARPIVLLLCGERDASALVETVFSKAREEGAKQVLGRNKNRGGAASLAAPPRQASLHTFSVESEGSIILALAAIAQQGLDGGQWVFVDAPRNTLDRPVSHLQLSPERRARDLLDHEHAASGGEDGDGEDALSHAASSPRRSGSPVAAAGPRSSGVHGAEPDGELSALAQHRADSTSAAARHRETPHRSGSVVLPLAPSPAPTNVIVAPTPALGGVTTVPPGALALMARRDEAEEEEFNGRMNDFLRRAARLIATRPLSTIHPQFRLFVRCPLEIVDANNVPQLARTLALFVPLVA